MPPDPSRVRGRFSIVMFGKNRLFKMWLNYKIILLLNRWLEVTQVDGQVGKKTVWQTG